MAIAKQTVGRVEIRRGNEVKAKVSVVRPPSKFALALKSLRQGLHELSEFVQDEIAYETMDTIRLVRYVREEFGLRPRAQGKPARHMEEAPVRHQEPVPALATVVSEPVRVRTRRKRK